MKGAKPLDLQSQTQITNSKEINLRLTEGVIREENTLTPSNLDISSNAENPFNKTFIKTEFQSMVFWKSH